MTRAIFIDRDGTINIDKDYLTEPEGVEFIKGSPEAIKLANELGLRVIIISNQSGVARGIMTLAQVDAVNSRLVAMLGERGAKVDAIYYCPHHPEYGDRIECSCRKPGIGMLLRARYEFGVDLSRSFVVGDKWSDVKCGENAGSLTSLVRTGYDDYQRCIDAGIKIDYLADDLFDTVTNFVRKKIETES